MRIFIKHSIVVFCAWALFSGIVAQWFGAEKVDPFGVGFAIGAGDLVVILGMSLWITSGTRRFKSFAIVVGALKMLGLGASVYWALIVQRYELKFFVWGLLTSVLVSMISFVSLPKRSVVGVHRLRSHE